MSVINQALKNLEMRNANASPAADFVHALHERADRAGKSGDFLKSAVLLWLLFPLSFVLLVSLLLFKPLDSGIVNNESDSPAVVKTGSVPSQDKQPEATARIGLGDGVNMQTASVVDSKTVTPEPVVLDMVERETVHPESVTQEKQISHKPASNETRQRTEARVAGEDVAPLQFKKQNVTKNHSTESMENGWVKLPVTDIKRPAREQKNAEYYFQSALEYLQAARIDPAIEQLTQAVRLKPDMNPARELLANLYMRSGRSVEAHILLKEGINLNPRYTVFAQTYARSLVELGQLSAARKALEDSLLYANGNADYIALLAAVLQRQGEHAAAVSRYLQALELNGTNGAWWVGMGISLEALGRAVEARQAYQAARQQAALTVELAQYVEARLHELGGGL